MRKLTLPLFLFVLAACGETMRDADVDAEGGGADGPGGGVDGPTTIDGPPGPDAAPGRCSHTQPFTSTVEVMGINGALDDFAPRLSHDELRIVFTRLTVPNPVGNIFVAERSSRDGAFTSVTPVSGINSPQDEYTAYLSENGLTAYYDRLDASGYNIYQASRATTGDSFGMGSEVSNVSNGATTSDYEPFVVPGVGMYFGSQRSGNSSDIWFAPTLGGGGFGNPAILNTNVSAVGVNEELPTLSMDGLAIYFFRYPGLGLDVWVSTRPTTGDDWGVATNDLGVLNTAAYEEHPGWLSDDNCRLYYASRELGNLNIRMAVRTPQ